MPAPHAAPDPVTPKEPLEGRTSGSASIGTPNSEHSSGSHCRAPMSNSMVRPALVASVAWTRPPVRFHTIQLSTVPRATSGPAVTPPSVSIHSSFEAEKYGSSTSPVRSRTSGSAPSCSSCAHRDAVRRSCHTMARWTGSELWRLQATAVSRWLVTPMAAGASPSRPATSPSVDCTASQISEASCSTRPGFGKYCVNSRWAESTILPSASKAMVRTLVVPASTANTTLMPVTRTGDSRPVPHPDRGSVSQGSRAWRAWYVASGSRPWTGCARGGP